MNMDDSKLIYKDEVFAIMGAAFEVHNQMGHGFTDRADFLVFGKIIIEIKALERLTKREDSQLLNYLKATGLLVGLLINFGSSPQLEWKRFANTGKSIRVYSRSFAD